jgi:hypothetical protein
VHLQGTGDLHFYQPKEDSQCFLCKPSSRKYSNGQFTAAVGRALTTDQDNIAELLMFSCKEHIACLHWTWEEKEKNLGSFDTNYIHNLSAYPPTNTIH